MADFHALLALYAIEGIRVQAVGADRIIIVAQCRLRSVDEPITSGLAKPASAGEASQ